MALSRIEEDVELKATGKEFFHMWCNAAHKLPDVSDHIHAVELHEDHEDHDWDLNGATKKWKYTIEGRNETFEERLEFDNEGMTIKMVGLKGDVFELYEIFNPIYHIYPKDKGCLVKVIVEFKKRSDKEDVPDPKNYLDMAVNIANHICAHHSNTK